MISPLLVNNAVLQGFVYNMALLMFRLFLVAFTTGIYKKKEETPTTAEDASFLLKKNDGELRNKTTLELTDEQIRKLNDPNTMTARVLRIHRNDMENILPFFIVCVPYVIVSSVSSQLDGTTFPIWNAVIGNLLMFSFTLSRYLYFVAYLRSWQPWRSIIWMWGLATTILIAVYTIICLYVL